MLAHFPLAGSDEKPPFEEPPTPTRRTLPSAAASAAARSRAARGRSVLAVVEESFCNLAAHPGYLIDGQAVAGLADRWLPPAEVRHHLLRPTTPFDTRDETLQWLLERIRLDGQDWPIVLAAMLLPGLRRVLAGPRRCHPKLVGDIEAEAFAGLLAAAGRVKPDAQRVAATLIWAARRAADRYLHTGAAQQTEPFDWTDEDCCQLLQPVTSYAAAHCDLVLADAVANGVLAAEDAELIVQTRLERQPVAEVASRLHISYAAASKRRQRAESRLRSWLQDGMQTQHPHRLSDEDFVADAGRAGDSLSGGRPRQGRRPDRRSGVRQPTTFSRR